MRACAHSLADVLPHRAPMILLDRIDRYDEERLVATVILHRESLFAGEDGVPAHIGIEYMAQTCGAYAGALALDSGDPVRVGYLLGTRNYRSMRTVFAIGEKLAISATPVFREDEMAVFDCTIEIDGAVVAQARLNVYQPSSGLPGIGDG